MTMRILALLVLCVWAVSPLLRLNNSNCSSNTDPLCQPEQVHIAFGNKSNDIVVTWVTQKHLQDKSKLVYGTFGEQIRTLLVASTKEFVDGGSMKRKIWIHRGVMQDLQFNETYVYSVGSVFGFSKQFLFTTPPSGDDWSLRAVVYGDLGVNNAISLPFLLKDVSAGKYDILLHVGDFAYNMDYEDGRLGDQFFRNIEPFAASVPYMTCPGNHEFAYNFSNYRERFAMPGAPEKMFFSYNLGPVHFVSINTEVYYNNSDHGNKDNVNKGEVQTQFNWLMEDLAEANIPANRLKHPWIILIGHRPMYCSNGDDPMANPCNLEFPHRIGNPKIGPYGLEVLLKNYGVDLVIFGHEHSYERMWPVFDKKVYNGSYDKPYTNPRAPVHVTSGSAGCREQTYGFIKNYTEWSAFRSSDYGYARLNVYNHTHLYMEQVSTQKVIKTFEGDVEPHLLDSFWLIKDEHQSYSYTKFNKNN